MESFWTRTCCRSYFTHTPKHTTTTATTTLPLTGSCSSSCPLRTHAKRDETAGKMTRNPDDPEVLKLRAFLRQHNGLKGLEVCAPHEVERAAQLFHRDGFVAVSNVLWVSCRRDATACFLCFLHAQKNKCGRGARMCVYALPRGESVSRVRVVRFLAPLVDHAGLNLPRLVKARRVALVSEHEVWACAEGGHAERAVSSGATHACASLCNHMDARRTTPSWQL